MDNFKIDDDINLVLQCLTKMEDRLHHVTEMRNHLVSKDRRAVDFVQIQQEGKTVE